MITLRFTSLLKEKMKSTEEGSIQQLTRRHKMSEDNDVDDGDEISLHPFKGRQFIKKSLQKSAGVFSNF